MCGIFGYVLTSARTGERPSLATAITQLKHRGPDGNDTFIDDRDDVACGLAHTRLAIIDLSSGGTQPMHSSDGRFTITFNGEIYNHRELRAELESRGDTFRSTSDTEVLLCGFRRWGRDLLAKLRGMFAFAIWDRVDRTLFLARDRLGVKPLYLTRVPGGLLFASEVRALLATGLVPRILSQEGLATYLAFGSIQEPATIVEGITMLPAGSHAELRGGILRTTQYWNPPLHVDRDISHATAIGEVAELLRESVNLRLVSDVPVGVFLSGGLDSSAVVALATEASRSPIHTFTVTFDETAYDEADRARKTAERFGADHHPIRLSGPRALSEMDSALAALDQPSADGINTYFVSKAVRDAGVTVALSGIGGDELFAGYGTFRMFMIARRMAPIFRSQLFLREPQEVLPNLSTGLRKGLALWGSQGEPFAMYSIFRAMLFPAQIARLLAKHPQPKKLAPSAFDREISLWSRSPDGDGVAAYSAFELTHYLRNTLLRDMDVMGMAHALEIREPLLDHRLVERLLTLPSSMKISTKRKKPLLVDAVPTLPREMTRAPKMGFTLPFETWLRGPLRPWAEDQFGRSDLLAPSEVASLWTAFDRGKLSYSRIWTLIALIDWTRRNGLRFPS